jgi:hypothetical protein
MSEYDRGHRVSGSKRHEGAPVPGDVPNEAANAALEAASKYLEEHGRDVEHIVVLVRTKPRHKGDRTGATALSTSDPEDAQTAGFVAILVAHAQAVMQAAGGELRVLDFQQQDPERN